MIRAFFVLTLCLLACGRCYAICANQQASYLDVAGIFSHTLDAEQVLVSKLDELQQCNASERKIIEAKFQLGTFWSQFGVENDKALALLRDVKRHYQTSIQYNRQRYSKTLLSLAYSQYLNGQFQRSLATISELLSLVKEYPDLQDSVNQNAGSISLLLAIALDGKAQVDTQLYDPAADLKVFNHGYDGKRAFDYTSTQGQNSNVKARQELLRITRWLQFMHFTGERQISDDALTDIDQEIARSIGNPYTDELMLSYALARLPFVGQARCQSAQGKFILAKHRNNQIESTINQIAALALMAECESNSKLKHSYLNAYLSQLDNFYRKMPPDFSIDVLLTLKQSSERLVDVLDWSQLINGWQTLTTLIQLKAIGSAAKSPARTQESGLANEHARKLFVERETLTNRYFSLHQSVGNNIAQLLTDTETQLAQIDSEIEAKYPSLLRSTAKRAISTATIQSSLDMDTQLLLWTTTSIRICGVRVDSSNVIGQCAPFDAKVFRQQVINLRQALLTVDIDFHQTSAAVSTSLLLNALITQKKTNILINSQELLAGIPTNALTVDAENARHWLGEKYNVLRLLNLATLTQPNEENQSFTFDARLAVANPVFNNRLIASNPNIDVDSFFRSGNDSLETLVPLVETEEEARQFVAGAKNMNLLLGSQATEAQVTANLQKKWDIVLFSTHTLFPGPNNYLEYPALALTPISVEPGNDGLLQASDIARLNVRGAWVVLAACDTANAIGKSNTLGSLLESFSLANANSVLASHWKVNSLETQKFMLLLSENMTNDADPADALWNTRKQLMQQYPPRVWSAFDLYL